MGGKRQKDVETGIVSFIKVGRKESWAHFIKRKREVQINSGGDPGQGSASPEGKIKKSS